MSFAQSSGETVYKAKCAICHGVAGVPSPGFAKTTGIKAVSDPAVKSMSEVQEIELTNRGSGKMPAYAGKLTSDQVKAAVEYFRSLGK
jgi:mono/diheme cytochrome c family protein